MLPPCPSLPHIHHRSCYLELCSESEMERHSAAPVGRNEGRKEERKKGRKEWCGATYVQCTSNIARSIAITTKLNFTWRSVIPSGISGIALSVGGRGIDVFSTLLYPGPFPRGRGGGGRAPIAPIVDNDGSASASRATTGRPTMSCASRGASFQRQREGQRWSKGNVSCMKKQHLLLRVAG